MALDVEWIAVGMPITEHPPHRTGRAALSGSGRFGLTQSTLKPVVTLAPMGTACCAAAPGSELGLAVRLSG